MVAAATHSVGDSMDDTAGTPSAVLGPLRRIRQTVEFSDEPIDATQVEAIVDVARWSGSANNRQPWRFIVIRSVATIRRIAQAGLPHTVTLSTASAAIAFVLPDDPAAGGGRCLRRWPCRGTCPHGSIGTRVGSRHLVDPAGRPGGRSRDPGHTGDLHGAHRHGPGPPDERARCAPGQPGAPGVCPAG